MTKEEQWMQSYNIAEALFSENGSLSVPVTYIYRDFRIGAWLAQQRTLYKSNKLSPKKIELLNKIEFKWNIDYERFNTYFEKMFSLLLLYKEEYGNVNIPISCIYKGENLGRWAQNMRHALRGKGRKKLTDQQKQRFESIGFSTKEYAKKLSTKWETGFSVLLKFLENHSYDELTLDTVFENYNLGGWIHVQRVSYKNGKLSREKEIRLRDIGFDFDPQSHRWEDAFLLAKLYFEEFGNLDIPTEYVTQGFCLGAWISNQRQLHNGTRKDMILSESQIELLESIGMVWHASNASNTSFAEQVLCFYLSKTFPDIKNRTKEFGFELDLYIPSIKCAIEYDGAHWHKNKLQRDNEKDERCKDEGINLIRIRETPLGNTKYAKCYFRKDLNSYNSLQITIAEMMEKEFGIIPAIDIARDSHSILKEFHSFSPPNWSAYYKCAEDYYNEHGNLLVPHSYVAADGKKLGQWIGQQRSKHANKARIPLTSFEIEKLERIGMVWHVKDERWERNYLIAKNYYRANGNLLPSRGTMIEGVDLGKWVNTQRTAYREGTISSDKILKLESIGMIWNSREEKWESNWFIAKKFYEEFGNLLPAEDSVYDGIKIGAWIRVQRSVYRRGKMPSDRIAKLESIGMIWSQLDEQWERIFSIVKARFNECGDIHFPRGERFEGYDVGTWLITQKTSYQKGKISPSRIAKLESVGMFWGTKEKPSNS